MWNIREANIKVDLKEIGCEGVDCLYLAQDSDEPVAHSLLYHIVELFHM
jgi:hypothetical protein